MEFKNKIFSISLFFALLFIVGCSKDDDTAEDPSFSVSISDVSETGFKINWSATSELNNVLIELSKNADLSGVIYEFTENQAGVSSHSLEQLSGATVYYYRVKASFMDGTTFITTNKAQQTSFTSEQVTINTPDGMELSGKLSYLSYVDYPKPAIILMHELGVWVNNWKAADVVRQLVAEEYVCLVFDFRGHGNSTSIPDLGMLINDWSLVATDLQSAMDFMRLHPRVDSNNFALAGGSLGACMALAGNGFDEVKSSVALSPSKNGIYQIFPELTLQNVCYIVGELDIHEDPNVNFPEEAEYLYGITEEPSSLTVVDGNSAHGTDLLESTGVEEMIVQWIKNGFEK